MSESRLARVLRHLPGAHMQRASLGGLYSLDARAHVLTTLAYIICVLSFDRYSVSALMPFVLYPMALCAYAGIAPAIIGRALLLAAPFVLLVGLWNPVFDNRPMLTLGVLTLSAGWVSLASLVLRCALCVSAVAVMAHICGLAALCAALPRLGVPRIFAAQILLLQQALYVLADEAARMRRARDVRSFGRQGQGLWATAPLIGTLLLRSLDRAERLHTAMLCRGFDGTVPTPLHTHFGLRELVFCGGCFACFALARAVDLPALGHGALESLLAYTLGIAL